MIDIFFFLAKTSFWVLDDEKNDCQRFGVIQRIYQLIFCCPWTRANDKLEVSEGNCTEDILVVCEFPKSCYVDCNQKRAYLSPEDIKRDYVLPQEEEVKARKLNDVCVQSVCRPPVSCTSAVKLKRSWFYEWISNFFIECHGVQLGEGSMYWNNNF